MATWPRPPMPLRVVRRARRRLPDPTPLAPAPKPERAALDATPPEPPAPAAPTSTLPDPERRP